MLKEPQWRCEICHEVRPDGNTSVRTQEFVFVGMEMDRNLIYCNDNMDCIEGAKTHALLPPGAGLTKYKFRDVQHIRCAPCGLPWGYFKFAHDTGRITDVMSAPGQSCEVCGKPDVDRS